MAGTATIASRINLGSIERIDIDWTSDASDGTVAALTIPSLNGFLYQVEFDPGASAPTAAYDVTLTSDRGYDVLAGVTDDLSATATTRFSPLVTASDGTTTSGFMPVCLGDFTFAVANAGNSKTGRVVLYLIRALKG